MSQNMVSYVDETNDEVSFGVIDDDLDSVTVCVNQELVYVPVDNFYAMVQYVFDLMCEEDTDKEEEEEI